MTSTLCFGLYFELLKNTSNNCLYVQLTELSSSLLGILNSSMDLYGLKNRPFLKYGNFSNCLTSTFEGALPNSLNNRPILKQITKDKDDMTKTTFLCFLVNTKTSKSTAGAEGFEPPDDGIKTRCLTTWLCPNTLKINSCFLFARNLCCAARGHALAVWLRLVPRRPNSLRPWRNPYITSPLTNNFNKLMENHVVFD